MDNIWELKGSDWVPLSAAWGWHVTAASRATSSVTQAAQVLAFTAWGHGEHHNSRDANLVSLSYIFSFSFKRRCELLLFLTLEVLKYIWTNHIDQSVFLIWNHHKCLTWLFPTHLNTYARGLRPLWIFLILKCGQRLYTSESDVYRRQILTSKVDYIIMYPNGLVIKKKTRFLTRKINDKPSVQMYPLTFAIFYLWLLIRCHQDKFNLKKYWPRSSSHFLTQLSYAKVA